MDFFTIQLIFLPIVIGFWIASNWLMTATGDPAYADNSIWRQSDARVFTAGSWLALNLIEVLATSGGGTFAENLVVVWFWAAIAVAAIAAIRAVVNGRRKFR